MTKILAESLYEFKKIHGSQNINEEQLNESSKGKLLKFLKNPEKYEEKFKAAFAKQVDRFGDVLAKAVDALDSDTKIKFAKEGIAFAKANPGLDMLQLPITKNEAGELIIKTDGAISGKGLGGRKGLHGGSSTKA